MTNRQVNAEKATPIETSKKTHNYKGSTWGESSVFPAITLLKKNKCTRTGYPLCTEENNIWWEKRSIHMQRPYRGRVQRREREREGYSNGYIIDKKGVGGSE